MPSGLWEEGLYRVEIWNEPNLQAGGLPKRFVRFSFFFSPGVKLSRPQIEGSKDDFLIGRTMTKA